MSRTSIETVTGKILDFAAPTKEMLDVQSIAWGISRQPRFCGQTVGEIQFNVAQHSLHVARLISEVMVHGSRLNTLARKLQASNKPFVNYLNSRLSLEKDYRLAITLGLFHDGSEGFLCDLPTPAKRLPGLMEAYAAVETKLMEAVHELIGITPEMITPELLAVVHWADTYALAIEAYHLVPSRGQGPEWAFLPKPDAIDLLMMPEPQPAMLSFEEFMEAYEAINSLSSPENKT